MVAYSVMRCPDKCDPVGFNTSIVRCLGGVKMFLRTV